ncbi:hypothetical protein [uncultured Ruminococcus sp.]|nr:hypothetical protein [uncultured Ruminococcus sp.]
MTETINQQRKAYIAVSAKSNKINSMRVKSRLLKMLEVPTVQINTV